MQVWVSANKPNRIEQVSNELNKRASERAAAAAQKQKNVIGRMMMMTMGGFANNPRSRTNSLEIITQAPKPSIK